MSRVVRTYHNNGQLAVKIPYYKNKIHGIVKHWYTNGQLRYEFPYNQGQLCGIEKWWLECGFLRYKVSYYKYRRHGVEKWYNKNKQCEKNYYLHGEQVTEEEYRKYKLIEKLACLK